MKRFIEGADRHQVTLLSECLDDYFGEDDPPRGERRAGGGIRSAPKHARREACPTRARDCTLR